MQLNIEAQKREVSLRIYRLLFSSIKKIIYAFPGIKNILRETLRLCASAVKYRPFNQRAGYTQYTQTCSPFYRFVILSFN